MARNRGKVLTAGVLAVAVAAGSAFTANGAFAAESSAAPASHPTARTVAAPARPLIEMRTARGLGHFYTTSATEAQNAEAHNGFATTGETKGLTLLTQQVPGSQPLNRLRLRSGEGYLISSSPAEQRQVANQFVNEGIVGFAYTTEQPGTVKLVRYSGPYGDWRLGRETRSDLVAAGYKLDGPVGWVPEN